MYQSWQHGARRPGRAGLLCVLPPFPLIAAGINKLLLEQVNAIFPKFMHFWYAILQRLPFIEFITIPDFTPLGLGPQSTCRAGQSICRVYLLNHSAECLSDRVCLTALIRSKPGGSMHVCVVFGILPLHIAASAISLWLSCRCCCLCIMCPLLVLCTLCPE